MYAMDESDMKTLHEINRQLFGDGSHLSADRRRDLANLMHVILSRAVRVTD